MKYIFKILYEPKECKQISEFLQKFDVIAGFVCLSHVMEFTSEKDLDMDEVSNLITKAYNKIGAEVHKIDGWKNE